MSGVGRSQRLQKKRRLGLHEGEVGEPRARRFSSGPGDAVGDQVQAHAKLPRMRGRVGVQIVAVAAAQFQSQRGAGREGEQRQEFCTQCRKALFTDGVVDV